MMQAEESLQRAGTAIIPATPWSPIGPSSTSGFWGKATGRVFSLLVDPRNSSVVYAGTHGGGVWKSRDGGSTWAPLTDKQPSLGAESVAFDPIVGAESLPNVFYEALKIFSRREFPRFNTREEAMNWLVREET